MYQLAYLSFATSEFDSGSVESGIDSILHTARAFNKENNITGMLLYKGGIFLQILEGDQAVIEKLYEKIGTDGRHRKLKLLISQNAKERMFLDWTMGYKLINEADLNLINTILPWQELVEDTNNRVTIPNEKILQVFKEFRFQMKWFSTILFSIPFKH